MAGAALSRRRTLVAAAAGAGTVVGAVRAYRRLSAASAGKATATAFPTRIRRLLVFVAGAATTNAFVDIAGSVFRPLLGGSTGRAALSATPTRKRRCSSPPSRARRRPAGGLDSLPGLPLTAVVWTNGRFETGVPGTGGGFDWGDGTLWGAPGADWWGGVLVTWDDVRFQADGAHPQVVWEDDVFGLVEAVSELEEEAVAP